MMSKKGVPLMNYLAIHPMNWARAEICAEMIEKMSVEFPKRFEDHQIKIHPGLALKEIGRSGTMSVSEAIANLGSSQASGSNTIVEFAMALADIPFSMLHQLGRIDEKELGEELNKVGMASEAIAAIHCSNLVDNINFYDAAFNVRCSWLQIAEELPCWRKELAKRAFNLKYHG